LFVTGGGINDRGIWTPVKTAPVMGNGCCFERMVSLMGGGCGLGGEVLRVESHRGKEAGPTHCEPKLKNWVGKIKKSATWGGEKEGWGTKEMDRWEKKWKFPQMKIG